MPTNVELLTLQLEEARAALRPFALAIAFVPAGSSDDAVVVLMMVGAHDGDDTAEFRPPVPVTVGDIRRAASALGIERHEGRIDSTRP